MGGNSATEQTPLIGAHRASTAPTPLPETSLANDNLILFRRAIGINVVNKDLSKLESSRYKATGLYRTVLSLQSQRNRQYHLIEWLYYIALGGQIIIGATLSSLGPQSERHSTSITILSIVNTSVAGILALLKGQGLPDRLRKDEYEMRKVRDFIEETEARLAVGGAAAKMSQAGMDDLVQKVWSKYNAARDTAEMNRPDSYAHHPEDNPEHQLAEEAETPPVHTS